MRNDGLLELRAMVSVASHRNFRAAAADLDMSSSALSRAVAAMEARMGVRLFHRTTRSVSLTEAGEQFLARVSPALREITDAMDLANAFRTTPAGTLRINTSQGAAQLILEPIVLEFLRRYPDMSVDLSAEGRFVDIVAEGFDAGIRLAEAVPQDMIAVAIGGDHSMAVVGSPEYFKERKKPKAPADLLEHECIRTRLPSGTLYRWEFSKHGEEIALDVKGRLTLDNYTLAIQAALAGAGLIYTSLSFLRDHIAERRLVRVLDDWTLPFPGLRLYYPVHRHTSAGLRAFIDLVHEMARSGTGRQLRRPQRVPST
ncbi:LysR family transcriptional regulator [Microvirga sp. BT688]|uniref:LysR family transcriptional regulator n=1 Tax=Microvirga sp. TaxID=1873136 RepID=UPI001687008B|nr:LysR family transcriptional regulator [Microvirga sp.]MBD2749150.1 LysR family transcriptional regulator [Microvirga sp.]